MSTSNSNISDEPRSRLFKVSAAMVVVAIFLGLSYLAMKQPSSTPAASAERLNIALSPIINNSLAPIATAKGYLAEEGLDVTFSPLR